MGDLQKVFKHTYVDNKADKSLFLLHGTGGTDRDFFFLNEVLVRKYNLVGLEGNIDEDGMARFFRRLSFGVFDLENMRQEEEKLHTFISGWKRMHKTSAENLFFLGYSNGANMLLATLFHYPESMKHILLLHPMLPFEVQEGSLDLSKHKIFLSLGAKDQLVSEAMSQQVIDTLEACGANVYVKRYQVGHEIGRDEIEDVVKYLA